MDCCAGRRGFASGVIAVVLSVGGVAYAAPQGGGVVPISAPEPGTIGPPTPPAIAPPADAGAGSLAAPPEIKSLTGKDLLLAPVAPNLADRDAEVAARLRALLAMDGQRLFDRKNDRAAAEAFYRDRGFAPLWSGNAVATTRAQGAIAFLRGVAADGLDPADYPTPQFARSSDAGTLAEDELRLTHSILTFARHARTGRIHFSRISGAIFYDLSALDSGEALAAVATASDISATLNAYHPQHPAYQALKAKLAELRAGGSGSAAAIRVPDGAVLYPGDDDMRVPILRRRLGLPGSNSWRYDDALAAAVKTFQKQEGLRANGVLGKQTVVRLNAQQPASRDDSIDTILVNMERWRWLPRELGPSHVVVNIPDFTLALFDQGRPVWSTRIVVGKPGKMATPLLSETMKYITVNPTWNVPPSIIRNEYLPVLARDPGALARTGLKMGRNSDGSIRIYQPPGERNALGRIRFNFPNKFLVYQHDTPDKHLFAKEVRTFSHGCMRVENPDGYAEALLALSQPGEGYTAARIRGLYGNGERTIRLAREIPVHLTYQTAFVDDAGRLQIRKDVYGHDAEMIGLLKGSDRRVADIAVRRSYASNSKPVRARAREYDDERPRAYVARRAPRDLDQYGYYRGYGSQYPSRSYYRPGFLGFLFR